jgi:hypothetical protein
MPVGPSVATLRLDSLEIARGHDGLLRGSPEPAVLLALYGCRPGRAALLDRRVVRFGTPRALPCTLRPAESVVMAPMLGEGDVHALAIAIGLEVDGGGDVERLFGALEDPDRWAAFEHEDAAGSPRHLEEIAVACAGRTARVQLLLAGVAIEEGRSDDVVGASVTSLDAAVRARRDARFGLRSPDGRNDWTSLARVGMRARPARVRSDRSA